MINYQEQQRKFMERQQIRSKQNQKKKLQKHINYIDIKRGRFWPKTKDNDFYIFYELDLSLFFIEYINSLLQNICGSEYSLELIINKNQHEFIIQLNRNDIKISHILLETMGDKIVYMHSETKEDFKNKKYNTFLRSVFIIFVYLLRYNNNQSFKYIGSNPSNWISVWILISKFNFKLFYHRITQSIKEFQQLLKSNIDEKIKKKAVQDKFNDINDHDEISLILDLESINFNKYLDICKNLLKKIIC